jgi:hypothetical protein
MWLVLCIVCEFVFNGHGQYYALRVTVVSSVMVVSFVIIVVAGSHRG